MAERDDYKRRKAQLEIEKQIEEAVKNSTSSLDSFAEAQKIIVKNYKLMREYQKEIDELIKLGGKDLQNLNEEEKERLEYLQQQQKVLIGVNKELAKGKNFAKAVGNEFLNWGKNLKSQFLPSITEAFNTFLRLNDLAIQTSVNIGLSGKAMETMVNNIEASQLAWGALGYDLESSARIQQSMTDETGRQVILSQQAQEQAAFTAKALNMQADELGGLIGQMDQFGLGSQLAMNSIMDMRIESEKMGVNSGKVIKKFQQNMELMNKLNFKDGIKGMQKMAALSEKYKIEMSSVAAAADKAFRPEGAIEMAAQLQVLGGSLASMGDPFQLMYKARNNPEKFMEDITQAAKQSATFDPKTKEFKISAYEMDRLRVAAEATGMSMEDLVKTARQGAKLDMFEGMLSGKNISPEDKAMLTGMMEMGEQGAMINGKLVSEMSDKDLGELVTRPKDLQKLQEEAMSAQAELNGIKNTIMLAFVELFKGVDFKALFSSIKEFTIGIVHFIQDVKSILGPTGTLIAALALYFGAKAAIWYARGVALGKGFNDVTGTGSKSFLGRMGDKVKGLFGKKSAMPTQSTLPPDPQTGISNDGKGGVGKTGGGVGSSLKDLAGGLTAMGTPQVLFGALNLIPAAVGLVAMVAAIPTLLVLGLVPLKQLSTNLFELALGLEFFSNPQLFIGTAVLAALGVAFTIFTAGSIGLAAVALLGGPAGAALMALIPALTALSALGAGPGWLAVGLLFGLAGVFVVFAAGVYILAMGVALVVDSFTNMFSVISADNIGALLLLGPALIGISIGIFALAASLIVLGAAYLMGGFLGLIALGEAADEVQTAFKGVDPQGINTAVNAINSIDMDKLNALKELSLWMSLIGATTTIKFDESLHIDGSIELTGESGGKSNTDWIKDPIFVSKLQQLVTDQMERDKNGGKGR